MKQGEHSHRDIDLSYKERETLFYLIRRYILDPRPVSSKVISENPFLRCSSSTIRSILVRLEKLGLVEKAHASSGRSPTDSGYRMFADHIRRDLPPRSKGLIRRSFAGFSGDLGEVQAFATMLLSRSTQYTGLIVSPVLSNAILSEFRFALLAQREILFTVVTDDGYVHRRVVHVSTEYDEDDLNELADGVNRLCRGFPILEIRDRLLWQMRIEREAYRELLNRVLAVSGDLLKSKEPKTFFMEGTFRLLHQPDFDDVERLRAIFEAFEEKGRIIQLLDQCMSQGNIAVRIGTDIPNPVFRDLSIVAATFRCSEREMGTLGIIGPKRMLYPRVVSLVGYTAEILSDYMVHAGEHGSSRWDGT